MPHQVPHLSKVAATKQKPLSKKMAKNSAIITKDEILIQQ